MKYRWIFTLFLLIIIGWLLTNCCSCPQSEPTKFDNRKEGYIDSAGNPVIIEDC